MVVPKKDHGFCDGAQHQVRNGREGCPGDQMYFQNFRAVADALFFFAFPYLFRIATRSVPQAPYDTLCFVLQNAAGARKWVADRAFEEALLQAFAHSVPSSQAMERRMKEGEGLRGCGRRRRRVQGKEKEAAARRQR